MTRNSDFCTFFCRHPTGKEEKYPLLLIHIHIEKEGEVELAESEIVELENRQVIGLQCVFYF